MAQLKRDKLKGSDVSAETAVKRHGRRLQPEASLKMNVKKNRRKRLGVGPDHKTPLMQKRHRGSFP